MLSDLSRRHLHPILRDLIYGAFSANWKQGDDANEFGIPVFGTDENLEIKYVEEYLRYVSCLYLTHPGMKNGQDWVEKDIHPTMATYNLSGKNAISYETFLVFNC